MVKGERNAMPTQAADERIKNFNEVALGYTPALAKAEAERCLGCKNAPCMQGCPVGVHIPDFIAKIKEGDMNGAASILKGDNN
ncbi:MAG: dihydropyrimidine dehydrogenase, partial [Clostridia bacterium]|nr:dihydropyrimidine dehydrogenase [Clostridia bacterium]